MKKTYEACPDFMREHRFEIELPVASEDLGQAWELLQRRETFTRGQVPPYRVEFGSGKSSGPFIPGEQNIHHGPLLHLPGEIGDIGRAYRSLFYYYGSFVISFRLIRPVKLELFKTSLGIRVCLHSFVHPFFRRPWDLGNRFFWSLFKRTLKPRNGSRRESLS